MDFDRKATVQAHDSFDSKVDLAALDAFIRPGEGSRRTRHCLSGEWRDNFCDFPRQEEGLYGSNLKLLTQKGLGSIVFP